MKRFALLLAVTMLVGTAVQAAVYRVSLKGNRESGGAGDPAGTGFAVVSTSGSNVSYYLWVKGIAQPTASHIHAAAAGANGSVVVGFSPTFTSPATGVWVANGTVASSAAQVQAIDQNPAGFYVNVHNATFSGGALRGQLLGDGPTANALATTLRGFREFPTPGSATGSGVAAVVFDGTTAYYYIATDGLNSPSASHIHRAARGASGGVVLDFAPTFTSGLATGNVTGLDPARVAEILANPSGFYANVHTSDFLAGAVRGQLAPTETDLIFPVLANNPGVPPSFFRSNVRILNLSDEDNLISFEWYPTNTAGLALPAATASVSVAAGGVATVDDAVSTLFQATGRGAVRLLSTAPFYAGADVFNDQRALGQGTFGNFELAVGPDRAFTSGTFTIGSHQPKDAGNPQGFRSNLGFFNPNASTTTVTYNVRKPDGTLVAPPFQTTYQPFANDVGAYWLEAGVPQDQQTLSSFFVSYSSDKPVFVFQSEVDNKTGDPLDQPALQAPAGFTKLPDQPPAVSITQPSADVTVDAGAPVSFQGSASDPDGDTLTLSWDFGDSVTTANNPTTHSYPAVGTYTATFKATDPGGLSATATRTITVVAPPGYTLTAVQEQIFTPMCSGCHPPTRNQDLRAGHSYASIVNVSSVEQPSMLRVKPGDPSNSYLYTKVNSGLMPLGGPPLTADQLNLIRQWITAGAKND